MKKQKYLQAFTLLELSLVILIIGLLMAAFLGAADLANDAKLRQAKTLTQNAPVNGISNLSLWFETTAEGSFINSEVVDGGAISRWNNLNSEAISTNYLSNNSATTADHPLYKESCINGLPCLYFNGIAGSKITAQRSLGVRSNYITAFFVFTGSENATATYASQLFISDKTAAWNGTSGVFSFTTSLPAMKFFYNMPSNYGVQFAQCLANTVLTAQKPYIYSVVDDYSTSIFHYINGAIANTATGTANSGGAISKSIGIAEVGSASYKGNVGEIIIFTKALSVAERKSVEQYLAKKWGIALS